MPGCDKVKTACRHVPVYLPDFPARGVWCRRCGQRFVAASDKCRWCEIGGRKLDRLGRCEECLEELYQNTLCAM